MDLGPQPLCNRFLSRPGEPEFLHPLVVGACSSCGLVQLVGDLVSPDEMRPQVDWISYREPEAHLDALALEIGRLPGLPPSPSVLGVSFKDDSLLVRLSERLGARTRRLHPRDDIGVAQSGAGVETIQHRLDPATAADIARRHGHADLVVARHILEHAHEPRAFVDALFELARPGGYVLLEAPDCTRGLDHGDSSTLWEEHSIYLTPGTFRALLAACRLEPALLLTVPSALEGLVIAVTRRSDDEIVPPAVDATDLGRGARFAEEFRRIKGVAATRLRDHGRVALFGAGHLGCMFVGLLGLRGAVEFYVDDHPQKRGRFMPGSRLPILGSDQLLSRSITLCLLGLAPESEPSVLARNAAFARIGGRFGSIFPGIERPQASSVMSFEDVIGS